MDADLKSPNFPKEDSQINSLKQKRISENGDSRRGQISNLTRNIFEIESFHRGDSF